MPDPRITRPDPYLRACAEAGERFGRWRFLLPTLGVGVASCVLALLAEVLLIVNGLRAVPVEVIAVLVSLATLVAFAVEWRRMRRKVRMIDERWRAHIAEGNRLASRLDEGWGRL